MHKPILELISEVIKSEIKSIQPIIGKGSVNQVYLIETSEGKVIARLNEERTITNFLKEKWAIEAARAVGVDTAQVIDVGEKYGISYMIISYLPGKTGDESPDNSLHIWHEIGKFAKLIHSVPVTGFGLDLINSEKNEFQDSWDKFLTYNISSLSKEDKLIELKVLDLASSKKIKEIFEKLKKKEFRYGLNHGDLSLKNTIIDQNKKVSLIDWGETEASIIPHFDFGEIIRSSLETNSAEFKAFLDGYDMTLAEFSAIKQEIYDLLLLRSIDKLRWAIDRSPKDIPKMITQVKRFIN